LRVDFSFNEAIFAGIFVRGFKKRTGF